MIELTDAGRGDNRKMSIAWPFFLRLPHKFRLFEMAPAPRPQENPARLRDRIERDVAAFASTHAPLTRVARN